MTRTTPALLLAVAAGLAAASVAAYQAPAGAAAVPQAAVPAPAIPDRPEKLVFKPIQFQPPAARDHRVVLKNGMVVYIAEDRALPLVNVSITVRAGSWLEPAGKEGLAGFTGSQMRRGGTKSLSAEQLDEKLDFLAAQVGTGIGATSGSASLNCLSDNLDAALALFVEVLKTPRFQDDRLALAKEQALQEMRKRNDESSDIEAREWGVLLYGPDFFTNRFTTEASRARDRPRGHGGLPPEVLLPGQHDRRRLGLVHEGGHAAQARGRLRRLAFAEDGRARDPVDDRQRRARASTASRRTSTRAACRSGCRPSSATTRTCTRSR